MQSNVSFGFYNNFFRSRLNSKIVLKAERTLFRIKVSDEILYQNFIFNLIEKSIWRRKRNFSFLLSRDCCKARQ